MTSQKIFYDSLIAIEYVVITKLLIRETAA